MTRLRTQRPGLLLASVLGVLFWIAGVSPVAAQRSLATLIALRESTSVRRSLQGPPIQPVARGTALNPGAVVLTDPRGHAETVFRDGRNVKLDVSTELEISAARAGLMRVIKGEVWVRVPRRTGLETCA